MVCLHESFSQIPELGTQAGRNKSISLFDDFSLGNLEPDSRGAQALTVTFYTLKTPPFNLSVSVSVSLVMVSQESSQTALPRIHNLGLSECLM